MSYSKFSILAVMDKNGGISKGGKIPWKDNPRYTTELNALYSITLAMGPSGEYNALIMGRKTWELMDIGSKPLLNRVTIILTRNSESFYTSNPSARDMPFTYVKSSLDEALNFIDSKRNICNTWVIGGGQLFTEALNHNQLDLIHISVLPEDFKCDKKLDFSNEHYHLVAQRSLDTGLHSSPVMRYQYYKRKPEDIIGFLGTAHIPSG